MFLKSIALPATFAALLLALPALAAEPGPTPSNCPTPVPLQLNCRFFGGSGSGKSGGWIQHCRADGIFSFHSHNSGDAGQTPTFHNDNSLKVVCDDGQGEGFHKVFDGSMKVRFQDEVGVFQGIRDDRHDDDNTPGPRIVVQLANNAQSVDDGDHHHHAKVSEINYTFRGYNYDIPGRCRIEKVIPSLY